MCWYGCSIVNGNVADVQAIRHLLAIEVVFGYNEVQMKRIQTHNK